MKITPDARVYIAVSDPDLDAVAECPDCGFDALLTFPLHALGVDGVTEFGSVQRCARCFDEAS